VVAPKRLIPKKDSVQSKVGWNFVVDATCRGDTVQLGGALPFILLSYYISLD
jgi:hypothetical protein